MSPMFDALPTLHRLCYKLFDSKKKKNVSLNQKHDSLPVEGKIYCKSSVYGDQSQGFMRLSGIAFSRQNPAHPTTSKT